MELAAVSGCSEDPARVETPPIDLVGHIGRCHYSLRVLNRIPKGAVIPVADALQRLIIGALDSGSELAWGRLLSFSNWGLGGDKSLFQRWLGSRLPNLCKIQIFRSCKLPLKRRVAAKFAACDVSWAWAVWELASAESLAPRDGNTLRALKEEHSSAPENLSLPDPPDGSVVPAVALEEDIRKGILSLHAGASRGPDGLRPGHIRSLVAHGSEEAGSRLVSALTDLVNVMLRGEIPLFAVPILYGANQCVIRKIRWWHQAYCCRNHIQEIVSKSKLKVSRPGSRRRAEAGPVGGLNQWGMQGGSACGPTLCQGLSPQKGPSEDRHA